jgi:hypothetical protein
MAEADTPTPPVVPAPVPVAAAPPAPAPAPKPAVQEVAETFTAIVDLQYGDTFIKAGEDTSSVPKNSVKWLLEQNFIVKKEVT